MQSIILQSCCVDRYEEMTRHRQHHQHVPVDAVFYSERDVVELRNDLLATQIYICAPEVLMLFSDNWDYQVCSVTWCREA